MSISTQYLNEVSDRALLEKVHDLVADSRGDGDTIDLRVFSAKYNIMVLDIASDPHLDAEDVRKKILLATLIVGPVLTHFAATVSQFRSTK